MINTAENPTDSAWRSLLRQLDRRMEAAVQDRIQAGDRRQESNQENILNRFAGLYVDPSEIVDLLRDHKTETDCFSRESVCAAVDQNTVWGLLCGRLGLTQFECDVVLLAFAAEIDTRYSKIISFLHDDLTRKRPSIGLACRLFGNRDAVAEHWDDFESTGRLQRFALIEVQRDENPRLYWPIRITSGAFRILTGHAELDPNLEEFSGVVSHDDTDSVQKVDSAVLLHEFQRHPCKRLLVTGIAGVGKTAQVSILCRAMGLARISLDLGLIAASGAEKVRSLGCILARESHCQPTLIHLTCSNLSELLAILGASDGISQQVRRGEADAVPVQRQSGLAELRRAFGRLANDCVVVIETTLGGEIVRQAARAESEYTVVHLALPDVKSRRVVWRELLLRAGWDDSRASKDAEELSAAFRLSYGSMAATVHEASRSSDPFVRVWHSARDRASGRMEGLAERIHPSARLQDLVVTPMEEDQLRDLVRRVRHRSTVIEDWGFSQKLGHGTGVNALFAGPPGTGKTMAAEVVANELQVPLYRIDCSSVVSKYLGETEKNLERIFTAAQSADALVFFDEADSLFGKRTSITDAHDRYANIETSYLLQRIERHEGLVILATNLFSNIDSAFIRRITQLIHFRQPDESSRMKIWTRVWPIHLPLSDEVRSNLPRIARRFDINGGNIKNAALTAAYLAAEDGHEAEHPAVQMVHVVAALAQEYRKLGRAPEKFQWEHHDSNATPLCAGGRS